MTTYELNPINSNQKSFYKKANVRIEGNDSILTSYNTDVARIIPGNNTAEDVAIVYGTHSPTTLKHIKEFLLQNRFEAESKKQIEADYMQYKWFDLHDEEEEDSREIGTLKEAKEWLQDFWQWNNEGQYTESELEKMFKSIEKASVSKLNNKMSGIGWTIDQL